MREFRPLVSIIIPVYNGGNYLKDAIDSALSQTYSNIEVLVINDGSDDGGETEKIAQSYGDKLLYFPKKNGGVATALNLGIENMRGEYFSWLSHDDMYFPNKIDAQISLIKSLADKTEIVFAGFDVIDGERRQLNRVLPLERYGRDKLETPLFALMHGMINGCSLLIHKSHFERVGKFREDLPTTQDFDLWFRMMRHVPCRVCENALHMTRVHDLQGSRIYREEHREESDALWINMMQSLTDEEKIQIGGSVKRFYGDIHFLLIRHTSNRAAIQYAGRQAIYKAGNFKIMSRIWFWLAYMMKWLREILRVLRRCSMTLTFARVKYGTKKIFGY